MKTLIKTIMILITTGLFLRSQGLLDTAIQFLLLLPILICLIAIPYGLLTNLITPSATRRQYYTNHTNSDYTE